MEVLDSSTRHELSKLGYTFARNISVSHIVRTLLKDLSKFQNVSEDADQLSRRNNDLSLAAMLYKSQLDEKEAELEVLTRRCGEEKRAYEEQIRTLEELLPKTVELPKSNILQLLGVTGVNTEALDLLRYADERLHELESTNRTLMTQLDKNVVNSGVLINKIKLRDAEIQRLTQLVNSGACNFDVGSSASNVQNKVLREENARLRSEIDQIRVRGSQSSNGHDFKAELATAIDERRELARQLDHYTSKVTALQKLLHKYEHELKMARLERDNALALDKSTSNAATSTEPFQKNIQDENGNVTNYGAERSVGTHGPDKEYGTLESGNAKTALYEKKISKLLKDLSILQNAVAKKDAEITQLRGEIAVVAVAHEENLRLRSEVSSLRKTASEFKSEIRQLRAHVREFTTNAARAADAAHGTATVVHSRAQSPQEEEFPQLVENVADKPQPPSDAACAGDCGTSRLKPRAQNSAAAPSLEAPALLEKVALLECEMRRLQAQAALDIENRLRTETRLREMEQNPPKKFKGLLRIDGGVMRTEFEMRTDSSDP